MIIMDQGFTKALADIGQLSNDDLKVLCNSDQNDKYDEIVNQTDTVKSLEANREMMMASVRSLAEFNLARQKDYESDRAQLFSIVDSATELKGNIEQKAAKLLDLSRKTSSEATLAVLTTAAGQSEEDSEITAKAFLNKELDYDAFITEYTQKRKLAHLRRVKTDKMRQEIRNNR